NGQIAIFPESTYMWMGIVAPTGPWGLKNRDQLIGWAPMPGGGAPGDPPRVSISGGGGWIINRGSQHPDLAWAVMQQLASVPSADLNQTLNPCIPVRSDLLKEPVFQSDPEIQREVTEALPYTTFRPALPVYPRISELVQQMVERCIQGQSIDQDLAQYRHDVTLRVGPEHVAP
ncbi:MAG TPA: hypothetical protein VGO93_22875, partial [Candidatus Xenobia bacterium]